MQTAEQHREQFELAYATAWAKDRDGSETPEQLAADIKAWREGDTYGKDLPRLRFGWEGYQWARAGQCLAQIEEPAPATFMTDDQAFEWAWNKVREDLGAKGWTAGDFGNFHGFFLHGWNYRGQYELQRSTAMAAIKQELMTAAPALEAPAAPEAAPWCPDVCPITGRPFFMWIEHWQTGKPVPTYGGPYDSYTIPVKDSDGSFECERYDHDEGGWLTEGAGWHCLGVKLVDDQSFVVAPANPRYSEIEAFAAAAPQAPAAPSDAGHQRDLLAQALGECIVAAGIVRKNIDGMSGPQLLMFAEDLKRHLAAPAAPAVDALDSARLDFVLKNDAFIVWTERDGTILQCQLLTQDEDEHYHAISGEHRFFNAPREAIDAAIAAQAAAKGAA